MSDLSTDKILCEVCVESVEGAVAAERGGADRIELCGELALGGISPSVGLIRAVIAATTLPVMVMVRPRAGNFCYSKNELSMMAYEIEFLKSEQVAGVVFGALQADGTIDVEATRNLTTLARPMSVTFHRAFDWTRDPELAIDALIDIGVDRLLTSGLAATAEAGLQTLVSVSERSQQRVSIMPGSGVSESNAAEILKATGAREIHFSAGVAAEPEDIFSRTDVPMATVSCYTVRKTSESRVRAICDAVHASR